MKIYFTFLYVVVVLVIKNSVCGKSLIFNKYLNGPHFEIQKQNDVAFDESKENLEKDSMEALTNSYKRSADEVSLKPSKRSIFEGAIRKRSPYGLVYNQGKPIGILEPIPQSFEYSAYAPRDTSYRNNMYKSQWFPVKRESEMDMDEMEKDQLESQTSSLHSSNYANVLAKFKVNNKVKHRPYQDYLNSQVKRASIQDINRRKEIDELKKRGAVDMGDLNANLKTKFKDVSATDGSQNKIETSKVDEIEENLKDVMGDMGLVEKDNDVPVLKESDGTLRKREIYFEDEDLENGLNKIGLTKESHNDRNKKEDCPGKTKVTKSKGSRKIAMDKSLHKKGKKKVKKDDEASVKRSVKSSRKRVAEKKDMGADLKTKVANYQYEGEEFIRRKRQEKEPEKAEDSDIMKGLESSGDLTVSGNKSPLVAVSNADDTEKKSEEKRDKEELEYEKRLERNIQAKINAIKEEVKREIGKLKTGDAQKDQQRKKREVTNTLLDEETSILDPDLNIDQKLEPHIRKRRDLNNDAGARKEAAKQKRDLISTTGGEVADKEADQTDLSINKIVREATKDKVNEQGNDVTTKVKRNELSSNEVRKSVEGETNPLVEQSVNKRDDKVVSSEKEIQSDEKAVSDKRLTKRSGNDLISKVDAAQDDTLNKNIEKRNDAFTATDRIETDNKAEFGTDAPDSIVKRSDQASTSLNTNEEKTDTVLSESVNVVKRSDKFSAATTDKCIDNTMAVDNLDANNVAENEMRADRSASRGITSLETGQTLVKDVDVDNDKDSREERHSGNGKSKNRGNAKVTGDTSELSEEHEEEARDERGTTSNKQNKLRNVHKSLRRSSENYGVEGSLITPSAAESNSIDGSVVAKKSDLFNFDQNEAPLNEEVREYNIKQRDVQGGTSDLSEDSIVEESSGQNKKHENEDAINERSAYGKHNISSVYADAEFANLGDVERDARKVSNKSVRGFQNLAVSNNSVTDEEVVGTRRKRRAPHFRYRMRHKRNENSYSENVPELMNYRADNDGEIDDEDDEMHDDGFDDQTSNFLNKRQAGYDSDNFESNEDQVTNEDYPMYVERNKRNALRMYDDENDAEESYDNFLFYPNRYSRTKRHNYENLAALHGGGMMTHAAALRERNMQPYEQSLRRKRLENLNRMRDQNENVAELSESDIFGGFPQSYEGELSRFKRVKRSHLK